MANELTVTVRLEFESEGINEVLGINDLSVTPEGSSLLHGRQSVGTSEEQWEAANLGWPAFVLVINRSGTGTISIRGDQGETALIQLKPGEPALYASSWVDTPYLISDVDGAVLEYWITQGEAEP
jgi:hypothetical protein